MCQMCLGIYGGTSSNASLQYQANGEGAQAGGAPWDGTVIAGIVSSGVQNIDALIYGTRWQVGVTVTYDFPDAFADYGTYAFTTSGFQQATLQQQTAVRLILEGAQGVSGKATAGTLFTYGSFESISGISIQDQNTFNAADLSVANTNLFDGFNLPTARVADFPRLDQRSDSGDVWFGDDYASYKTPVPGTYAWVTTMHEFGHSFGLKHGHASDHGEFLTAMTADRDSMEFSVMTYRSYVGASTNFYVNETYGYAQTLMMYDIATMQYLYGANFTTNNTDTRYSWSPTTGEMFLNDVGQGAPGTGLGGASNRIFLTIWDGGGVDTYDMSNYTTAVSIDLSPGGWSVTSTDQLAQLDTYYGTNTHARGNVFNALQYNGDARSLIENAWGGAGADIIIGNSAANELRGNGGADRLEGNAGNDRLLGGAGDDLLLGGLDNDWLQGDDGNDRMYGGDGADYLLGGNGADYGEGGAGGDRLYGGLGDDYILGLDGDDYAEGGAGSDSLYGGAGSDYLIGGDDADYLVGGDGVDFLYGQAGADYLMGGLAGDMLQGDDGVDYLYGEDGNDYLYGGADGDMLQGGAGSDALYGEGGDDYLYGGADNDMLMGGLGGDALYGDAGNDYIYAGDATDYVEGGDGADVIYGDGGNDYLYGNAGNDYLSGGDGGDVLDGGPGDNYLLGGAGGDLFVFNAAFGGVDTIFDFEAGANGGDVLRVSGSWFTSGAAAIASAYTANGNTVIYMTANSGVILYGVTANQLDPGDFLFV